MDDIFLEVKHACNEDSWRQFGDPIYDTFSVESDEYFQPYQHASTTYLEQHERIFDVDLGKPFVPSYRADLVDHLQPSSLDIIAYLEHQDDVLFASLEQQCFLSSRASLGQFCLLSSRENKGHHSQPCFPESDVDLDDDLGQQEGIVYAGFDRNFQPYPSIINAGCYLDLGQKKGVIIIGFGQSIVLPLLVCILSNSCRNISSNVMLLFMLICIISQGCLVMDFMQRISSHQINLKMMN